jgi:hypothetical protein
VNTNWDNHDLDLEQVTYAARDAYASLQIYHTLTSVPMPQPVTKSTSAGTLVTVFSRDRSVPIAYGFISPVHLSNYNGINVTKTRILVQITDILVPSYELPSKLLPPDTNRVLSAFGEPPFTLLCHSKHLQTHVGKLIVPSNSGLSHANRDENFSPPCDDNDYLANVQQDYSTIDSPTHDSTIHASTDNPWDQDIDANSSVEQNPAQAERDPESERFGRLTLEDLSGPIFIEDVVRSRVLGDVWHLMHQFAIPVHHGLRRPFSRALRDAILLPNSEDKAAILPVLEKRDTTYEEMVLFHSAYIHCQV